MSSFNSNTHDPTSYPNWGLTTNALDAWLENDLNQSSLLHKNTQLEDSPKRSIKKLSLQHIMAEDTPTKNEATQQVFPKHEFINKSLPSHLIPLIRAYSLINTMRKNNKLITKEDTIENDRPCVSLLLPEGHKRKNSVDYDSHISSDDYLVAKRQRNTDAARRSRLKKTLKMESLERRVEQLKSKNNHLRVKIAVLETERSGITESEKRNRYRVLELEAQLAEAHKQLIDDSNQITA
ncbi:hypothetical protein BDB01DRAFT_812413 [Pilobolus umbonatus]|nr:hypothetical protein BDB01DRAFT_812413 [Pilobolus umbonatus]